MRGLRTKRPHTLAWQGFLAGGFMVLVVTRGDWLAALEAGIAIGLVCFLIGLAYRTASRFRGGRIG
jgi:hypothetical protein